MLDRTTQSLALDRLSASDALGPRRRALLSILSGPLLGHRLPPASSGRLAGGDREPAGRFSMRWHNLLLIQQMRGPRRCLSVVARRLLRFVAMRVPNFAHAKVLSPCLSPIEQQQTAQRRSGERRLSPSVAAVRPPEKPLPAGRCFHQERGGRHPAGAARSQAMFRQAAFSFPLHVGRSDRCVVIGRVPAPVDACVLLPAVDRLNSSVSALLYWDARRGRHP